MFEIIPNYHPMFVHFTVALLTTSLLFHLVSLIVSGARSETLAAAARWNFAVGVAFTIATVATGLLAYGSVNHDTPSHLAMTDHRNWALGTFVAFLAVAAWAWFRERGRSPASTGFVVLLALAAVLLSITAFKGGELVYRYGLGVMSIPAVSGEGHEHEHPDGGHDEGADGMADADADADAEGDGHEHEHAADESAEPTDEMSAEADDGHAHEQATPAVATGDHSHGVDDVLGGDDPEAVADLLAHAVRDGDEAAVMAILAEDVLIFETGGAERSAAEYQGHHMPSDMAFLAAMEIEQLERKSEMTGDAAWVSTRSRLQGTFRESEVDLYSTESLVMTRIGGQWRVTHIHWSSRPAGEDH
jgi:uncharacterized membrane protein/ketosteroid isomerase-like protein